MSSSPTQLPGMPSQKQPSAAQRSQEAKRRWQAQGGLKTVPSLSAWAWQRIRRIVKSGA